MQIETGVSLKPYNTFGLPAVARTLVRVASDADVRQVVDHPEFGMVDDLPHIGIRRHTHQRARNGRQAEGVVRLEADPRFDLHATIFSQQGEPHAEFRHRS